MNEMVTGFSEKSSRLAETIRQFYGRIVTEGVDFSPRQFSNALQIRLFKLPFSAPAVLLHRPGERASLQARAQPLQEVDDVFLNCLALAILLMGLTAANYAFICVLTTLACIETTRRKRRSALSAG